MDNEYYRNLFKSRLLKLMNGKTINKLSKEIGISHKTISSWLERGKVKASYLIILSKYFGVSTDYLVGLE